ncbi:hypothetical protein JRQ81_012108 [Phrynocephalus forsythii]|uniref:Reverse transcriptase Ty1/copia-type domain-containing protein n=1 Tax=Phrynocephalus forsythii TaxID=171643 RepID=A0A9Q0X5T6_9SAUR|nr:hypothetical protein JRQ81_012108 [Phrynocephalus forsythii]
MASRSCFCCGSRFHLIGKGPEKPQEFQHYKAGFQSNQERRRRNKQWNFKQHRRSADKELSALTIQQESKRNQQNMKWIIDSGASHKFIPHTFQGYLKNCKTLVTARTVTIADNSKREMKQKGTIYVDCLQTNLSVFILPGMKNGLLSVSNLIKIGFKAEFKDNVCIISKKGKELVKVSCKEGLFVLDEEQLAAGRSLNTEVQAKCVNKAPHTDCAHLLHRRGPGDNQEFLLVYVDDLIYASKAQKQIQKFNEELVKHFKIKNIGEVKVFLGVQIDKTENGSFVLNWKGKILQMLEKCGISECAGVRTPMEMGFVKNNEFTDSDEFKCYVCQSAIGSLLHLSQWSRPVNLLSRETSNLA